MRDGVWSPTEVMQAHIAKARAWNPAINAVTESLFDHAQARADELSSQLKGEKGSLRESWPPFFGVPFSIKEMIAVKGCRRTGGSWHRRHDIVDFNATVVQRLIEAGAIPLCTTNVPELGFWVESDNSIYGRTKNPYDLRRTSGGSSGGEGALIGAGASPFGLGTDIGGSIRIPAAFCGVFGHKPTWKTLPLSGFFPRSLEEYRELKDNSYPLTSVGFLARKAADLWPLMNVLSGPDTYDPMTQKNYVLHALCHDVSKMKVFVLANPQVHSIQQTSKELQISVQRAASAFAKLGATIIELDGRLFKDAVRLWGVALSENKSESFKERLSYGHPLNYLQEFYRLLRGQGIYTFPGLMTSLIENSIHRPAGIKNEIESLSRLDSLLKLQLGLDGILICPCYPTVAPRHRRAYLSPFDFVLSGIFSILGYPSTAIPMGLNAKGIPLGIQVVASPFQDHLNFSVALVLERQFGGWVEPHVDPTILIPAKRKRTP